MAGSSDFEKPDFSKHLGEIGAQSNDLKQNVPHLSEESVVQQTGTHFLYLVRGGVDTVVNQQGRILEKMFTLSPGSKILWDALVSCKADLTVVEEILEEWLDPEYFHDFLRDYLTTLYIALKVCTENRNNVSVFQHKERVRVAAQNFARSLDSVRISECTEIIREAVILSEKSRSQQ